MKIPKYYIIKNDKERVGEILRLHVAYSWIDKILGRYIELNIGFSSKNDIYGYLELMVDGYHKVNSDFIEKGSVESLIKNKFFKAKH